MSAGAIVAIAIAATGILLMHFRKRWLARINIVLTNRITSLFAGWLPGFGILTHVGRKSGKVYRTPVNVFRAPDWKGDRPVESLEVRPCSNISAYAGIGFLRCFAFAGVAQRRALRTREASSRVGVFRALNPYWIRRTL
jgi:hypothetical protein